MSDIAPVLFRSWPVRRTIAVFGGVRASHIQLVAGFLAGRRIAQRGNILVTGATAGVPYAAALGAHSADGLVIGISPAADRREHTSVQHKPFQQADFMLFTGAGTDIRSAFIVRSVLGGVFIGGEFGTLGEFCSAWQTPGPRVWGILEGAGGLAPECPRLVSLTQTNRGNVVIAGDDPEALVDTICDRIDVIGKDADDSCAEPMMEAGAIHEALSAHFHEGVR
jgi:uncharacterized protein (TIGR00725 family)